jgi:CRISPR/Cas system CMR-associated protein Cmr5 small subunit
MNQRRIDEMIPVALELLENPKAEFSKIKKGNKIISGYSSAIDAFGPAVVQAGIAKTLAFYMKESGGTDRRKITELVKAVINEIYHFKNEYKEKNLLDIYIEETKDKPTIEKLRFKDKVLEAVTACKLAKLSFEKDESDKKNKEDENEP